jgi:hypothetical protein
MMSSFVSDETGGLYPSDKPPHVYAGGPPTGCLVCGEPKMAACHWRTIYPGKRG